MFLCLGSANSQSPATLPTSLTTVIYQSQPKGCLAFRKPPPSFLSPPVILKNQPEGLDKCETGERSEQHGIPSPSHATSHTNSHSVPAALRDGIFSPLPIYYVFSPTHGDSRPDLRSITSSAHSGGTLFAYRSPLLACRRHAATARATTPPPNLGGAFLEIPVFPLDTSSGRPSVSPCSAQTSSRLSLSDPPAQPATRSSSPATTGRIRHRLQ